MYGLLAPDKALEHLEEEVEHRDADERDANGDDVRENDPRITSGGSLQGGHGIIHGCRNRESLTLRKSGGSGTSGGNSRQNLLVFHFVLFLFFLLPLIVEHRDYPPGRAE